MQSPYAQQVADAFLSTPVDQFGDAHVTTAEIGALRRLYEASGRDRIATLDAISEHGYPLPRDITPEMVALSGAAHACGVAIDLAETRGIEGKDSTYESYTTKNRFDRFTSDHLPKTLLNDWAKPIEREVGYANSAVVYPEGVDENLIHGIAKPHRYYPAQTMRYLEFARLGKLDDQTAHEFGITETTDLSTFSIDWASLTPTIESAQDVVELSGKLSAQIARELLGNGLSSNQVAAILNKGYSLGGMRQEHGQVTQSDKAYSALLAELNTAEDTALVAADLVK